MQIMHLQEMALLSEDANVYKLVGPALIKQDPVEAKSNVETRLNLIKGELSRLEGQAKSIEEKRAQKQQQVGSINNGKCYFAIVEFANPASVICHMWQGSGLISL